MLCQWENLEIKGKPFFNCMAEIFMQLFLFSFTTQRNNKCTCLPDHLPTCIFKHETWSWHESFALVYCVVRWLIHWSLLIFQQHLAVLRAVGTTVPFQLERKKPSFRYYSCNDTYKVCCVCGSFKGMIRTNYGHSWRLCINTHNGYCYSVCGHYGAGSL